MKKIAQHIILSLFAIVILCLIEKYFQPIYIVKSISKILIFGVVILIYCYITGNSFYDVIHIKKIKGIKKIIIFSIFVYFIVLGAYCAVKNYIDLASIKESMLNSENINQSNFYFVFIYIILINSLLEELFFRGFVFSESKNLTSRKMAYIYSGLLFSFYHIGIIFSWFSILIFLLCLALLFIAGLSLDYFTEKYESCLASWIVHVSANLAINTIGIILMLG